ncbi:MAG TPA: amidohydrolase family protein [Bacteroidia bacterium]|nr:amidohydrolase family protein [Bacteroidia bacterium]
MNTKNLFYKLFIFLFFNVLLVTGMNAQTKSVLIMNATAHLGTGGVIQNAVIGIHDGKIDLIADATTAKIDQSSYEEVIDASGKQVYPGFIAPNSTLGLTEIEAVRATNDFKEVGSILPHIRSIIAYNTDSKIIPTVRCNGVLLAQVTPRGGLISGTSSIVQLNGWNWEDAAYKIDDGIHINWPRIQSRKFIDEEKETLGPYEKNKEYTKETEELKKLFLDAKAYSQTTDKEKNLRFEAIEKLLNGTEIAYIHTNDVKEMIEAIHFAKTFELKKVVIVGGRESYLITDLLKENNIAVMVPRVHELPEHPEDDVDQSYKLPYLLQKAGILFCLNNAGDQEATGARNIAFLAGTAAAYGLTKEQAIQAVTLNTAKILGIDKTTGSLETGKDATLFISAGDALDMRTNKVEYAFIKGVSVNLFTEQQALYERYKTKYGLK